jgi:hypothetical protein
MPAAGRSSKAREQELNCASVHHGFAYEGSMPDGARRRFFIFIFFKNIFYRNIFSVSAQ